MQNTTNLNLPRHYPRLITDASNRATDDRIDVIASLQPLARMLLQKIVRSINIHDFTKPAYICNDTFAQSLKVSVTKVCRLKTELEEAQLITRHQVQSRRRGMQVSETWLTDKALNLLFFAAPASKLAPYPVVASNPTSNTASPSLLESHTGGTLAQAKKSHSPQPVAAPRTSIPDDLKLLEECGINEAGIYKLMGIARDAGHYLGHIVRAAGDLIFLADKPFSYVRKLISSPSDWKERATQAIEMEQTTLEEVKKLNQHDADMDCITDAMKATGMLASAKGGCVWILEDGSVKQAEIKEVLKSKLVRWAHLLDISGLANAVREGKLFAVDRPTLQSWVTAATTEAVPTTPQEAATEAPTPPALIAKANAYYLSQSLSERHPGGGFEEKTQEAPIAVSQPPQAQNLAAPGFNLATLANLCGITRSDKSRTQPVEVKAKPVVVVQNKTQINHDLEVIRQAMQATGMLASAKRTHVWILETEGVKKAEIKAVLKSSFVPWMHMMDTHSIANAVREGKLFAVDRPTLQSWVTAATTEAVLATPQEASTEASIPSALIAKANAYYLSQSLSERHPGGAFKEKSQEAQTVVSHVEKVSEVTTTAEPACPTDSLRATTYASYLHQAQTLAEQGFNPATLIDLCGITHSGKGRSVRVDTESKAQLQGKEPEPPPNHDLQVIQQAMQATGMLASAKRTYVWAWIEGWVRRADAQSVVQSKTVPWLLLADIAPLAAAIRDGKLFAVDRQMLNGWA